MDSLHSARLGARPVRRILLGLALALGLAGCAPATDGGGPVLAVINAPADARVPWLADAFERSVADSADRAGVRFASSAAVRFEETHRDFHGSRAPLQASFLARRVGADLAAMLGAPVFEREVVEEDGDRTVQGTVRLELVFVDPATAEVVGSMPSRSFTGSRTERVETPLPPPEEDPTMRGLAEEALADLAPHGFALAVDLLENPASPGEGRAGN